MLSSNAPLLRVERVSARLMADLAPVMIWVSGADKQCIFFNRPWLEFRGRRMEEELGDGWTEGLHPEDKEMCIQTYNRSFDERLPLRMEYRIRRHDGTYRWVLDSAKPIITEDGTFMGYIGTVIDIDDMKRTEELNRKLQEQVFHSQKMEAIGSMAAGLAHDLKNLLTVIKGNSDLIKAHSEKGSKTERYADNINEASMRASELVNKLLLVSRRQPMNRSTVDLGSVAYGTLQLIESLLPAGIEVRYEKEEGLWPVEGDQGMLEQMLVNLVTNARDAMPSGGTLLISLRNEVVSEAAVNNGASPGCYVVLTVSDSGIGMTPEVMSRMFDPFFTTKPEGKGTGLGLSIAYGVVKGHGGWIEVKSEIGKGSVFNIYLPVGQKALQI